MAYSTNSSNPIEIPDDDEEVDLEFLYQLDAIEADALSLSSSSKRRRISVANSHNSDETIKQEEVEEGAYTAALKGSKSLTWQKQQQQQQSYVSKPASDSIVGPTVGGGGSSGGCFKCGKEGHWARECPQVTSLPAAVGPTMTAGVEVEKACPCGLGICLVLTANTERNRGRKFFRCPVRQENGGCGFFEWCDESSGNRTPAVALGERTWNNGGQQQSYQRPTNQTASAFTKSWNDFDKGNSTISSSYGQKFETTENKGYGVKSDSSCFKCGQPGHWAKDCITTAGARISTNVTANARGNSSSDACFKCGQSGHWARDCSQDQGQCQSTKLRKW